MEIGIETTKLVTNWDEPIRTKIQIGEQELETFDQFKYLGALTSEDGSQLEAFAKVKQTSAALARLKLIWEDKNMPKGLVKIILSGTVPGIEKKRRAEMSFAETLKVSRDDETRRRLVQCLSMTLEDYWVRKSYGILAKDTEQAAASLSPSPWSSLSSTSSSVLYTHE
ncbi:hypothetical protein ElyMa_005588400 [Elysia marginata]|uniref:Uncharacterized protein n=1 Tax=Elysia marginata TaxID=1093978 RepID=A0AAV4F3R9_9GAST|nr:hypothetical protein ElyMa_005588400 [Elysia marginata]